MRILSATIEKARYARDFGQVEATVALLVKDAARPVPYVRRIFTTEPARAARPLRRRLIESATTLFLARHEAPLVRAA
ncbi:hypothetical protein LAZ40_19120 [Cereibacter sphaeroides]|uniref:hypothetical protein n=1 Tax=Rhodobacterales TaxID=204455 RepID=UPI000BBE8218|nr:MULTISPECIES: hypothetical protein [Paracoccaceae]MCE6961144.1 hypothetical protein [Cereibacter sphaeroides]MCE6969558.1 hypothetical protein [Cereibacter sphaeroides]MCE6972195.1 hypothetical protein [Cereibacter sphaeroides]